MCTIPPDAVSVLSRAVRPAHVATLHPHAAVALLVRLSCLEHSSACLTAQTAAACCSRLCLLWMHTLFHHRSFSVRSIQIQAFFEGFMQQQAECRGSGERMQCLCMGHSVCHSTCAQPSASITSQTSARTTRRLDSARTVTHASSCMTEGTTSLAGSLIGCASALSNVSPRMRGNVATFPSSCTILRARRCYDFITSPLQSAVTPYMSSLQPVCTSWHATM